MLVLFVACPTSLGHISHRSRKRIGNENEKNKKRPPPWKLRQYALKLLAKSAGTPENN